MITAIAIVGGLLVIFIGIYNSLIVKRNNTTNAFASIDIALKKRFDLIPNLVASVQQYAQHEQETFSKITALRTGNYAQMTENDKVGLASELDRMQSLFYGVAENYPALKASENFLHLQGSLNETEEQLSAARRAYNAAVTIYNNAIQTFPTNMVASMFDFTPKFVLETREEERQNPDVKSLFR